MLKKRRSLRFELSGRRFSMQISVSLRLTGRQIWAGTVRTNLKPQKDRVYKIGLLLSKLVLGNKKALINPR